MASPFNTLDENGEEGCFFCFPDLCCRITGSFRLKFALVVLNPTLMMAGERSVIVARAMSEPFKVYNPEEFPGRMPMTPLTKYLREKGCMIAIKKGDSTLDVEHKCKPEVGKDKLHPQSHQAARGDNNQSEEGQCVHSTQSALKMEKEHLDAASTSSVGVEKGSLFFTSDLSALGSPNHPMSPNDVASIPMGGPGSSSDSDTGEMSEDSFWFGSEDVTKDGPSQFLPVESAAVNAIISAYQDWKPADSIRNSASEVPELTEAPDCGQTATKSSDSSLAAASHDGPSWSVQRTPQSQQTRRKRQRKDDEPGRRQPAKRKRVERGARRLACPFQKRYPLRHFLCGTGGSERGFDTISNIKEHLKRRHVRSPIYCPRCKTEFDDPEERDSHISRAMVVEPCDDRAFPDETALPWKRALADAFKARVSKELGLEDQWFSLWRIVFPGVDPPAGCLVDDDVCEHVLTYYELAVARGTEVVREVIREHGLLAETNDQAPEGLRTTEQLRVFAERVFGLAAETIFRDWSRRDSRPPPIAVSTNTHLPLRRTTRRIALHRWKLPGTSCSTQKPKCHQDLREKVK